MTKNQPTSSAATIWTTPAESAAAHVARQKNWSAQYADLPKVTLRGVTFATRPWLAAKRAVRPHLKKVMVDAIKRPRGRKYARLVRALGDHGAYCALRES